MKNGFSIAASIVLSLLLSSCFDASKDLTFIVCNGEVNITGIRDGVSVKVLNIPSMLKTELYETECKVTSISSSSFCGNENLKEIIFPEGISIGKGAFEDCTNLRKIVFTGSNGEIESGAFANCLNLQEVIGINNVEAVSYGAFNGCINLKNKTEILARECTIDIHLEDFKVEYNSKIHPAFFHCNMCDDLYIVGDDGFLTGEIVVPEGERWIYKDHSVDFAREGRREGLYESPYIRTNLKGGAKKYVLPRDGREFALYGGDVFQIGGGFGRGYYDFADISVTFSVRYED